MDWCYSKCNFSVTELNLTESKSWFWVNSIQCLHTWGLNVYMYTYTCGKNYIFDIPNKIKCIYFQSRELSNNKSKMPSLKATSIGNFQMNMIILMTICEGVFQRKSRVESGMMEILRWEAPILQLNQCVWPFHFLDLRRYESNSWPLIMVDMHDDQCVIDALSNECNILDIYWSYGNLAAYPILSILPRCISIVPDCQISGILMQHIHDLPLLFYSLSSSYLVLMMKSLDVEMSIAQQLSCLCDTLEDYY